MRHARLKPDHQDTWHHCFNRIVGSSDDLPFTNADKEMFVRILKRLASFYAVRVVSYVIMSNHFHIILQAPVETPSQEETAERYAQYYLNNPDKPPLEPGSAACLEWAARLRDVSWFMRHFQHLCTAWYNRTRTTSCRGTLWSGRFKNTILESGQALWNCWKYVEHNPVRAGIVEELADYRFCSYGEWAQRGQHPFAKAVMSHLAPNLPRERSGDSLAAVMSSLTTPADKEEETPQQQHEETSASANFALTTQRRVRYWCDGLAIGSEIFVRQTISRYRPAIYKTAHRLGRTARGENSPIYAWRHLRTT